MAILKTILFLGLAFVAFTGFAIIRQKMGNSTSSSGDPGLSAAGFFLISREDAGNQTVTIMSPPNCPSEEAARARALADGLRMAGIPAKLEQSIVFTFTDPADAARVEKHSGGNLATPIVLVRGWAKGNPTLQDIIAQYRAK